MRIILALLHCLLFAIASLLCASSQAQAVRYFTTPSTSNFSSTFASNFACVCYFVSFARVAHRLKRCYLGELAEIKEARERESRRAKVLDENADVC